MKDTNILRWIVILPIIAVVLTSVILTNIFISSIYDEHQREIHAIKTKHIDNLKNTIEERIEHLAILLENSYLRQLTSEQNDVKNIVDLGHRMLENIYLKNKHLPKKEIYKIINQNMHKIRFFDNNSGYYFIYDLEDGTSISLPSAPQLVGKSLVKLADKKGKNLFDSYGAILDKNGEGFDKWYWNKPNEKVHKEKIGYIKKFTPLNIGIGAAVYTEDIKASISTHALDSIKKLIFSDNSYIFVMNTQGTSLHHKKKEIINVPLEELDEKIQTNVKSIIKKAKESNGSFIEYTQSKKLFSNPSKKISYIKYINSLDWIIGTGLYTDKLNEEITHKTTLIKKRLQENILTILLIASIVSITIIVLLIFMAKKINKRFKFYDIKLRDSNIELKQLNTQLEEKVQTQVKKIRQKDLMLNQQSKLSAMGEMIGNISHQWRQPLSAISTLASGILVQRQMGMIDEKQLEQDLDNIVTSTQVLSSTIDDFRNFYSAEKEKSQFDICELINKSINLVSANLDHYEVKLITSLDSIKINSFQNEVLQVLLNLINNAKDALKDRDSNRYIFINTFETDANLIIEICDNANGIKDEYISQIFDPYFTTKGKEGTGIGLYMSKNIIENSLKGSIKVTNKEFKFEDETYMGACFTITLPIENNN